MDYIKDAVSQAAAPSSDPSTKPAEVSADSHNGPSAGQGGWGGEMGAGGQQGGLAQAQQEHDGSAPSGSGGSVIDTIKTTASDAMGTENGGELDPWTSSSPRSGGEAKLTGFLLSFDQAISRCREDWLQA